MMIIVAMVFCLCKTVEPMHDHIIDTYTKMTILSVKKLCMIESFGEFIRGQLYMNILLTYLYLFFKQK